MYRPLALLALLVAMTLTACGENSVGSTGAINPPAQSSLVGKWTAPKPSPIALSQCSDSCWIMATFTADGRVKVTKYVNGELVAGSSRTYTWLSPSRIRISQTGTPDLEYDVTVSAGELTIGLHPTDTMRQYVTALGLTVEQFLALNPVQHLSRS